MRTVIPHIHDTGVEAMIGSCCIPEHIARWITCIHAGAVLCLACGNLAEVVIAQRAGDEERICVDVSYTGIATLDVAIGDGWVTPVDFIRIVIP